MATHDLSERPVRPAVDRSYGLPRSGSIGLVLLVALALVGAATALLLIGRTHAEPYTVAVLAVLAMIACSPCSPAPPESCGLQAARRAVRSSKESSTVPSTASWSPIRPAG